MNSRPAAPRPVAPLLAAVGLAFCMAAQAAEPTPPPATGYYQGMKVGIDPKTGRLRALSAQEIAQLRTVVGASASANFRGPRAPANEAEALRTQRAAVGGGVGMEVPEDRMSTLTATQRADGTLVITHSDGHAPASSQKEAGHE